MKPIAFLALFLIGTAARDQTPAPRAGIVGGSLAGIVRNATGAVLADVSVTLLGETAATRTDSGGRFALRDVWPGNHTALFRRIGYGSVEYRWIARPGSGLQIAVVMMPIARQLDRIIVTASGTSRRHGTSSIEGFVLDSVHRAISGADVRLLGAGLTTRTDTAGRFEFRTLAAGSYIVRARRQGFTSANYIMQIADDDARGITLTLYGLLRKTNSRDSAMASGYGVPDVGFAAFDRRARGASAITILGPADLFRANGGTLEFVLRPYVQLASPPARRASALVDETGATTDGDCVLIDGRHARHQPLRSFATRDMQLVEVIPTNAWADEFLISEMQGLSQCRGSMDRHPSYFVLWTRSLP
jgi:hypothetical protein